MQLQSDLVENAVFIGNETEREYLDEAIIGVCWFDSNPHICYSYASLAEAFSKGTGMSLDEAYEHIEYNVIRSLPYISLETRPVIVDTEVGE